MIYSRWRAAPFALLIFLFVGADAIAAPTAAAVPAGTTVNASLGVDWFSVHLQGRKIGQMRSQRSTTPAGIETVTELSLELERSGERLPLMSRQSTLETEDGRPLSFTNWIDTGGTSQTVTGRVVDGRLDIVRTLGSDGDEASASTESMPWPKDAVLAEGARMAAVAAGSAAGASYRVSVFDLDALRAIPVHTQVRGLQTIDVHDRSLQAISTHQRFDFGGSTLEMELWLDPRTFLPHRLRMPMLGVEMEMLACDESCATAPNQVADVLAATSVASPRALSRSERAAPLVYSMVIDTPAPSIDTIVPGQLRSHDGEQLLITVEPDGDSRLSPTAEDTRATRWLQSDHPELVELADSLVGRSTRPASVMRKLERGVARQLTTKSLRIGYASALEAARLKEGDCTEHALLLAALARARGIPARVATGLAYAPSFSGRDDVFVPHAWVYAWVDGHWRGYDAALPSFGSGHLALDIGDGDPFNFYSDVSLLGRLSIRSITAPDP